MAKAIENRILEFFVMDTCCGGRPPGFKNLGGLVDA